jgi:hypothetical protein
LFDDAETAERAGEIVAAILEVRSLRLTDIAVEMEGESAAGYKRIQRFLEKADPRTALWRLFQEDAEFVIGDPTEIERPHAWKTEYVGKLKDGKTRGFWVLILATPYRGRAIPCGMVTYSSKTIAQGLDSRNLNHCPYENRRNLSRPDKLAGYDQAHEQTADLHGKMVALLLLTFTIGLLVGEELRDLLYGEPIAEDEQVDDKERIPGAPSLKKGKKMETLFGPVCPAQTKMDAFR